VVVADADVDVDDDVIDVGSVVEVDGDSVDVDVVVIVVGVVIVVVERVPSTTDNVDDSDVVLPSTPVVVMANDDVVQERS
jgi:hypothetical protein